jgi:uncharacterized protein YcfL
MAVAMTQRVGGVAPTAPVWALTRPTQPTGTSVASPSDEYRPTLRLKMANAGRTIGLAAKELFGGHTIDAPKSLQKPWQRTLHRVFPGGLVTAAFSQFQPQPAGAAIPATPLRRSVDARAWMPLVHFGKGETVYPTDPGFDGNANVQDNMLTYRRGKTDGNQEPTFYVSAATVGEYTVLRYDLYYVDNRFMNYHPHDWEGFSVYLKPDDKGQLQPAYLMTNWHHDQILTPWSELQFDAGGRPTVMVDRGAHGSRPLKRGKEVPAGRTLHPQGYWYDKDGISPQPLHLRGDGPLLRGVEPVMPLADGRDPRQVQYASGNWILGFIRQGSSVEVGPMGRASWQKPLHPLAYGVTGTVRLGAAQRGA